MLKNSALPPACYLMIDMACVGVDELSEFLVWSPTECRASVSEVKSMRGAADGSYRILRCPVVYFTCLLTWAQNRHQPSEANPWEFATGKRVAW